MKNFFRYVVVAPIGLFMVLWALSTATGTLNSACGDSPECLPTNDAFTQPLERAYDFLVPFQGFFVVVTMIAVVFAVVYLTLTMGAYMLEPGYESEEDFVADMDVAQATPRIDHTEANRAQVIGWDYGLRSGAISREDMRLLEPAVLQERLDTDNPSHDKIFRLSELIELHANATERRHIRRRDRMIRRRDLLRTHPEALHLNALSGQVREALEEAREADQSVRKLPEG